MAKYPLLYFLTFGMTEANPQQRIITTLATELALKPAQIQATITLLDEGATVPFIARYRKEQTGSLDDSQLRTLETRLTYLRELEERRQTIVASIQEQGKLDETLAAQLQAADTKQRLEDLYAPYKRKRRTRAQKAREAGLQLLVEALLDQAQAQPLTLAENHLNPDAGFDDAKACLNGARDILAEQYADNADLVAHLRAHLWEQGYIRSRVVKDQETAGANFRDWFNFDAPLKDLPSHRVLAMLRGRNQGFLDLHIGLAPALEETQPHPCWQRIAQFLGVAANFGPTASPRDAWLAEVCRWTWRVRLQPSLENEILNTLREQAEAEAIQVFSRNLKDLLLAAPAGPKAVLGLDPGIRTGVKVAAIDATGKLLETTTIYPFAPRNDTAGSLTTLQRLIQTHHIALVAIGNGTASRETEQLVAQLKKGEPSLRFHHLIISEAGASVYSASELASEEFPDTDVSLRGAISIARRLQDPLAELVKIEPKAIGVGQYQHDINQRALAHSLDIVIEDCVNAVGVDVNTASPALLQRVSGLSTTVANNIVQWRNAHGAFKNRQMLLKIPRFGPKTFEQAAGFLRIRDGDNPLDSSAVHPEAYGVANRILQRLNKSAAQVMGQSQALKSLSPSDFVDKRFGLPTVKDIFQELEKPGRDPRPDFQLVQFKQGITRPEDLKTDMVLDGVVTNVANFGAFVDIGVQQDGLVHISALADRFVKDPRDVVRVGQAVTVKVIEVDLARRRISLSMRLQDSAKPSRKRTKQRPAKPQDNAMAAAFSRLKK